MSLNTLVTPQMAYSDVYHRYWIADASQLNLCFGTSNDLLALLASKLHHRGMSVTNVHNACIPLPYSTRYLMVDIIIIM